MYRYPRLDVSMFGRRFRISGEVVLRFRIRLIPIEPPAPMEPPRPKRIRAPRPRRVITQWDRMTEICWKCGKSIATAAQKYRDLGVCRDHHPDAYNTYKTGASPVLLAVLPDKPNQLLFAIHDPEHSRYRELADAYPELSMEAVQERQAEERERREAELIEEEEANFAY